KKTFSVDLIPHTISHTNLGSLEKGSMVNLEVDLIARYLKRLLDAKESETKYEYLLERGFI
ncbi:MAG: riboflavin synthase, partial [Candidatus Gracilibacteria bacterium]|nr:riboflavin synthase [Candidatus Gracilibacteria bacterium]